jgi:ATP-dependent exoDNAse (exonuclease V) alpha subunit
VVRVLPVTRQVKVPADSARRKELREKGQQDKIDGKWEIVGEITYLPLRVAYASTTHKSQGLSLDRVQVNIRDPFFKSPGMLYVALSRARTAEGLRLVGSPQTLIERCVSDPRLREWL